MAGTDEAKREHVQSEISRALDKEVTVTVEPAHNNRESSDVESLTIDSTWKPGFWNQFPWFGVIGLTTVILCSVAAWLVLETSNEKPASKWCNGKLAPNVLISIFNNLSNLALTLVVGQGIAISWWRRALSGGTVKQLHYSWAFSTSVAEIFRKFKYFNMIAVAVLTAKLAVIDGILYQKATITYLDIIRNNAHNEPIETFGALVFPVTARMGSSRDVDGLMTYGYETQVMHWDDTREDIDQTSYVTGCNGADCHYFMHGAGFSMSCTNTSTLIDYGQDANSSSNPTNLTNLPVFGVNFTRSWPTAQKNYSSINLDMMYAGALDGTIQGPAGVCPMNLTRITCELRPAVLDYKLQYTNGSTKALSNQHHDTHGLPQPPEPAPPGESYGLVATLNDHPSGVRLDLDCVGINSTYYTEGCGYYDPSWQQVRGVRFIRHSDIVERFSPSAESAMEGLYLAFQATLASQSHLSYVAAPSTATNTTISNATWHLSSTGMLAIVSRNHDPEPNSCAYTFADPLERVMNSVNTLTLMTIQNEFLYYEVSGEKSLPDPTRPIGSINTVLATMQTPTAVVHYEDIFYASSKIYMYVALGATLIVVLTIAPVFYGFWELGRKVTLGPMEIANAFQGPAFAGVKGDHVDEVLKSVGKKRVVYGQADPVTGVRGGFKIA